ncbi:MAG: hypothetical protein LBS11_11630 [Oscillospiraceae bacterium]|nr:hypothetical protein [Oscillospiraceae bacterium]
MERVTAEVFIPATGSLFDFQLPVDGIISEMALQMARSLEAARHNIAFDMESLTLFDRDTRKALPGGATVAQCGIMDGWRLTLL